MKNVKRLVKMERKSRGDSEESQERQGTYYQFLIERKVPNGTLKHIASLINVQYEFIPDNSNFKRQKIEEEREKSTDFCDNYKPYYPCMSTASSDMKKHDAKMLHNLELKRLEDKPSRLNIAKDLDQCVNFQPIVCMSSLNNEVFEEDDDLISQNCAQNNIEMKKSKSSYQIQSHLSVLNKNPKLFPCNLKVGPRVNEKCSNPTCSTAAKYFITYTPNGKMKISCTSKDSQDLGMKRCRSMSVKTHIDSKNLGIIRNSKVKYVKAEAFKRHEKIRDMEFEQKLCELITFNSNCPNLKKNDSFKVNDNLNSQWLEQTNIIEPLNEDPEEDKIKPINNTELILAKHYGSYDEEDYLKSLYSSMKDDSYSCDFDLQVIGTQVQLHKTNADQSLLENACNPNIVSQLGSKIIIGEPSGDVFGLCYNNQYSGIFRDDVEHEFLPLNTLHQDN